jgi:Na+/melibiose symporter-like transporter
MKPKILAFIRQKMRATNYRLAAFKSGALLWLARHSTIFNKIYPNSPKRRFFIVKAKLINFYQSKVQPKLAALKTKMGQARQRVTSWLARHRRRLTIAATVVTALAIGLLAAYLYQRSPALQRLVQAIVTSVAAILAAGWALLRGRPVHTPAPPVVVTEAPRPASVPAQPEPDGQLL